MRWLTLSLMFLSVQGFAAVDKKIDTAKSEVKWAGKHVKIIPGDGHFGIVKIKSGSIKMEKDNVVGGEIIIDLNSIEDLDLKTPKDKAKLEGHLKSPDFFSVEKFPTAKLVIVSASPVIAGKSTVTGKLTIRDKTEVVTFPVTTSNAGMSASGKLTFDRTKFGAEYGSLLSLPMDKAIANDIVLDFNIVLKS